MKKEFNLLNNKSTFLINLVFSVLEVLGGFLTNRQVFLLYLELFMT